MLVNFTYLPLGEGFGINTNLLETNILNLSVVIGVLVYFGGDVLSSLLTNRKELILYGNILACNYLYNLNKLNNNRKN